MRRTLFLLLALAPGCGLTLDLQPGEDASNRGFDAGLRDASDVDVDAGSDVECTDNADCDDGDPCNGVGFCDLSTGGCVFETAPSCDDGDACTVDSCVAGACVHEPIDCEDGIGCTEARCNPDTGECTQVARDELCPASPVRCERNECVADVGCVTLDLCDVVGGVCDPTENACVFADCIAACAPLGPCIREAYCEGDVCVQAPHPAGTACDSDMCRTGICTDEGICVYSDPRDCDDGEPCTIDGCDPATGCVHSPRMNGRTCDTDGSLCTVETCSAGACELDSTRACADADMNLCTAGVCDPATGTCATLAAPSGTTCGVNAACNGTHCECAPGFADCDGGIVNCSCDLSSNYCVPSSGGAGSDVCVAYEACPLCPDGAVCCPCTGTCVTNAARDCVTTRGDPCPTAAAP